MKKKTWIASALMYAAVFLVCIGVLHVLKSMTEGPAVPSGYEEGMDQEENREGRDEEDGSREENASDPEAVSPGGLSLDAPSEDASSDGGSEDGFSKDGYLEEPEVKRETGFKEWEVKVPDLWTPVPEKDYIPPKLILATDLHYQSASAQDGGRAFQLFVEQGDGKVVRYLPELLEAFIDEVIKERPSALVLSGDITMNGERINHEELAQRLKRVQEAGIPVLVIPGNHDINNPHAAVYIGNESRPVPSVSGEEFYESYRQYGYDQAVSRDRDSLSYVFELDEKNRLLMLDSCQYEPRNQVEGRLKESTMEWAEEQLKKAKEEGVFVLPVAHHNLLAQSRMYTTQCAMDNNSDVIGLLERYEIPLFFSGHLHVQRIKKHKSEPGVPSDAYGIQEIVTDALSIPPCQYGRVTWEEDGSIRYATRSVDVAAWAEKNGSTEEDLLNFEEWSYQYIEKLITDQIRGVVKNLGNDVEHSMAAVYAGVYIDYYAGRKIDAKGVRSSRGYRWWQRNMPDSYLLRELDAMIEDADRDNNYFLLPERLP